MEGRLEWKERYNIGVDSIDGQHRRLFRIINKLHAFSEEEDKRAWAGQEVVKYFDNYAEIHCAQEEAYMESISYKYLEVHKRLHQDFRFRRLPALEKELAEKKYSKEAMNHLRGVCTGWLVDHIQGEDQLIVGKAPSKWMNLLREREMSAVSHAVTEKLHKIFDREPQLLSECYEGQRYGDDMYFRFSYGQKERGKQDVILIFEKKLLVGMLDKLVDDPHERNAAMLMEVVLSMAEQLEDLEDFSLIEEGYELLGKNQLTSSQFQRILQRQHPIFSLLFDTGQGYFGYCVLTPYSVHSGGDASEPEEEGMAAESGLGKLLETEEKEAPKEPEKEAPKEAVSPKGPEKEAPKEAASPKEPQKEAASPKEPEKEAVSSKEPENGEGKEKRRVLVVDDSNLARQIMKRVLQVDYQVDLAKSGIAAIRGMAAAKPDLIVLDYNMPICSGPQFLEMIRSEEDWADIPVIFLSATIDKEGVKRVIPLRPQGYLLKSMKPIEIKKKIDRYFERESAK